MVFNAGYNEDYMGALAWIDILFYNMVAATFSLLPHRPQMGCCFPRFRWDSIQALGAKMAHVFPRYEIYEIPPPNLGFGNGFMFCKIPRGWVGKLVSQLSTRIEHLQETSFWKDETIDTLRYLMVVSNIFYFPQ